jgi:hypothetical protein
LELLGKISDVGLFAEKTEVTVTHQSTDDLRNKLRGKLEKLVEPVVSADIEDADYEDIVLNGEVLNLDEELGLAVDEVAEDEGEAGEERSEETYDD